jgi:hypothetical protein
LEVGEGDVAERVQSVREPVAESRDRGGFYIGSVSLEPRLRELRERRGRVLPPSPMEPRANLVIEPPSGVTLGLEPSPPAAILVFKPNAGAFL